MSFYNKITISDNYPPYMVFEFMEFGDLADLLRKSDPELTERKLVLKQVSVQRFGVIVLNEMLLNNIRHS